MRDIRYVIIYVLLMFIGMCSLVTAMNNTYGKVELRMFNKLNNTAYTYEQWRIYQYDIKRLHPFVDGE